MRKKMKQFLFFMMAMVMMFTSVPMTAFADDADDEIPKVFINDSDNDELRLIVTSTQEITIGKTSTISVTLKNTSDIDWKNTKVQIASEEDYKEHYEEDDDSTSESNASKSGTPTYPFEIVDSLNAWKSVGSIKAGAKKSITFRVTAKKDLKEGYYPVLIKVKAEDESGNPLHSTPYVKTVMVWAKVKSTTGTTETETGKESVAFALGESQSTPQGVYGEVMNFQVNMRNIGYSKAYDVRVELQISENVNAFPFEINDGNYDRWMGDMDAGQTVQVPYSMAIREDATSGYYPLKFKIKYREEENGSFMTPVDGVLYVRIIGQDEGDKISADAGENERTKARIIVDSYETEPAKILAGQDFILRVKMRNASSQITASNILFTFDPESVSNSPVFVTVNGSDSIVVNNLAPGATEVLEMHYSSSPSAEQRSYTVTITEQYDSPEYKNAKETVKIAVPLKQEARLNTNNIEVMPSAIEVGNETNIMFDINNTGKVLLYNVTAIFEGDSIQRSENYIGNIKPGESGSVDAMVLGTAATMDDGMIKLIIQYEDEGGTVSSEEKEIQLFVSEPMPEEDMNWDIDLPMDVEPEPTAMDKVKQYAFPLGAAAVIVLGTIVFVLRRKKKKAGMDDEIL